MKLYLSIENERELASTLPLADKADDAALEAAGSFLTTEACRALFEEGIDYELVYRQSVGAFEIVQVATDEEQAVWDGAIAVNWEAANDVLAKAIKEAGVDAEVSEKIQQDEHAAAEINRAWCEEHHRDI